MRSTLDQNARPVIFGEVLFDHYPDGSNVLAGAALGVAWHLQGFGLRPLLVTRIGQDSEGELALTKMHQWGLDTRTVQIDHQHPTGSVMVSQANGENQFEIKPDQAWDYISSTLVMDWIRNLPCSLIYAGSLAQRNAVSRKTLQRLMLETQLPVFMDINLREPWLEPDIIQQCLNSAHWLKLSDTELQYLVKKSGSVKEAATQLKSTYDIKNIFVTCAERGSAFLSSSTYIKQDIENNITLVDSVGAGDAYTAVCILGYHKGWDEAQIVKNANQFAGLVCQKQGAIALTQQDYSDTLKAWS